MKRWMIFALEAVLLLSGCAAEKENAAPEASGMLTVGTETQRSFLQDNVFRSDQGDIHYSSSIPVTYDGSEPYALFITLPGWEGLYFQGVGANMVEDFGPEAARRNEKMIVISPQLNDWGETSAKQSIALTEFLIGAFCLTKPLVLPGVNKKPWQIIL